MVNRYVASICVTLTLSGCYDRFHGPSLRNGFDTAIEVTVRYADGAISSREWPQCFEAYTGKTEDPGDVIQEIEIRKEGEVIHRIGAQEVQRLLEKEEAHDGYSAWSIGRDGIHFETTPDPRCSQGRRES